MADQLRSAAQAEHGWIEHDNHPEWFHADWHCLCGSWGNHMWMGYAKHLEDRIRIALDAAPPAGLREALEDIYERLHRLGPKGWPLRDIARVALDATPDAAPSCGHPIDAERLSLGDLETILSDVLDDWEPVEYRGDWTQNIAKVAVKLRAAIAAAYAGGGE